jgi:hypothetical protein
VGGWLIYAAGPIFLGIPLAIVLIGRSRYATLAGLVFISWPLIAAIIGPVYGTVDNYFTDRSAAGDLNFFWPAQRRVAHAILAHDITAVRQALPKAGDVNAPHRGKSLFAFAMQNLDDSPASAEIVAALLEAGADPNLRTSSDAWPLTHGVSDGPEVTKLLLDAGANPNQMESIGRPVWWNVLYHDSERDVRTLAELLDHGADVRMKDGSLGPVGWAAYQKSWRSVWLLIQRGAPWKDETAFGQPLVEALQSDLRDRRYQHQEIPEEMYRILEKYGVKGEQ